MKTVRRGRLTRPEGYMMVDHRAGEGLPLDLTERMGLPPLVSGSLMESATITCSHCGAVVVLNPNRQRSRGYCPKCDHYICDGCEARRVASSQGDDCVPLAKIGEDALEAVVKGIDPALVLPPLFGGRRRAS